MDIFPFLSVIDENSANVSVSTPMLISGYHFITKRVKAEYIHTELLFHPLQWNIWLVFVLALLTCFLLSLAFAKLCEDRLVVPIVKIIRFAERCFGVALMGLYMCNLMAIVNVKMNAANPFSDIEELTHLVEKGEKTLVTDNFEIMFIWKVLSGTVKINDEYPVSLQNLYNATRNNPPIEIADIKDICQQLTFNGSLVYLGRLTDTGQYCSQYCFWSLPIPDIPLVLRSYSVGKGSGLIKQLNLCVDFMRTYTSSQISRSKNWSITTCKRGFESNLINMRFIINAVWILIAGFSFSAVLFLLEKYRELLKYS